MSRPGDRRPQRPKVRNFVAKHAKDVAGRAGPHKDKKHDYERHPRNRPGGRAGFDPYTGEPIELDPIEKTWVLSVVTPGNTWNPMPSLPEGMVLRAVWTVIDRDRLEDEGLTHNVTAFREDKIHDYLVQDDKIRFYSRVCETGVPVELAFEFETLEASLERTASRARRMGRRS